LFRCPDSDRCGPAGRTCRPQHQKAAGKLAMDMAHAAIVIIEPMDVERAGVAGADLPALPSASRGCGAAVGRDIADGQRFTAVLDGGDGFKVGHWWWRSGRVGGGLALCRPGVKGDGSMMIPGGLTSQQPFFRTAD
jgi:hypothetical protein